MKVSDVQLEALCFIIDALGKESITYHLTGGIAGNIYGSQWPLLDIDLEVSSTDLYLIEERYASLVITPVHLYKDEEFEMWLLQLNYKGVSIDINSVEDFFIIKNQQRLKIATDLNKAEGGALWEWT